ncbi:MAG: molecular chaperone DnaJ [Kocuria sp.]|nr:molecular chaperone DnaJ [Kocuria sp.]
MSDHYQTLGVSRDASGEEIKRAYRKKARSLHPDVNPSPEAAEEFKRVAHAHDVLSDPEKRRIYDATGDENGQAGFGGGFGAGFGGSGAFGGFGDIFDAFFQGGTGQQGPKSRTRQGQDALITQRISLQEAVFGTEKRISVDTAVVCSVCHGSCCQPGTEPEQCGVCGGAGQVRQPIRSPLGTVMTVAPCHACEGFGTVIKSPCQECYGQGRVRDKRQLNVKIPAGVGTGTRIRLTGQGEAGTAGGPNGDLYVETRVEKDPTFRRDGDDLHMVVRVPMVAAALGTTLKVDTFDGPQDVAVEPGTQSGQTRMIDGLGVGKLNARDGARGNLMIHVEVDTPSKLDDRQRELLQEFAQLRGEHEHTGTAVSNTAERGSGSGFFSRLRDRFSDQ